jgi:hypothetical protein
MVVPARQHRHPARSPHSLTRRRDLPPPLLQFQKGLPYFPDIESAASHGNHYCGQPPTHVINGYHVVIIDANGQEYLCAGHAAGLEFRIVQQGKPDPLSVPSLFRYHLRLLGTNPANWTRKPIA